MSDPNKPPDDGGNGGDGGGGGGELTRTEKAARLERYVGKWRIGFDDFRGYYDFPNRMLERDAKELEEKLKKDAEEESRLGKSESSADDASRQMEPILVYIMNRTRFLPKQFKHFAHWASLYDDKCKGTDIVFGMENDIDPKTGLGELMTFSIDATTSTNQSEIHNKFMESAKSRRGALPWGAEVHYCYNMANDERYSEWAAPHFVLGLSPASIDVALDHIHFGDGKITRDDGDDIDTNFELFSEIYEQTLMQLAMITTDGSLAADKRRDFVKALAKAVKAKLRTTLVIEEQDDGTEKEAAFLEKYNLKVAERKGKDDVYKNIINEARLMRSRYSSGHLGGTGLKNR